MVFYCSSSLYHILCFCIHKCLEHPGEEALLIIPDNIFSKSGAEKFIQKVEAAGVFTQVELIRFTSSEMLNIYSLSDTSEPDEIDEHIRYGVELVDKWLRKRDIDIKAFSEINTAIDHRLVGLYLLYYKIPYQYFEDGNGLLSRYEEQLQFHKKVQIENYHVIRTLGGLGNNPYVTKKYANTAAQLPGFTDALLENFVVSEKIRALNSDDLNRILKLFLEEETDLEEVKPCVLFLTRFVRYLQNPVIENHRFITAVILDLYCEAYDIIIKPHPRDFTGCYEMLFPDCKTLPKTFPSELLEFVFPHKFKKIITIGSTAIEAMTGMTEEVIKLGIDFEEHALLLFEYYATIIAMSILYKGEDKIGIVTQEDSREFLQPLVRIHLKAATFEEEQDALCRNVRHPVLGIVEKPLDSLWSQLYDGIYFLNQRDKASFYQNNILPSSEYAFLHVQIEPGEGSLLTCRQEAIIPVYIQSDQKREELKNIRFHTELAHIHAGITMRGGLFR